MDGCCHAVDGFCCSVLFFYVFRVKEVLSVLSPRQVEHGQKPPGIEDHHPLVCFQVQEMLVPADEVGRSPGQGTLQHTLVGRVFLDHAQDSEAGCPAGERAGDCDQSSQVD